MKAVILGVSGFVGRHLCDRLVDLGWQVMGIDLHSPGPEFEDSERRVFVQADTTRSGPWQDAFRVFRPDAVINLAGRTIFSYWTSEYKDSIYNSRVKTTASLVEAMAGTNVQLLINASAMGYYGDSKDDVLTESAAPGNDFLAKVCTDWETAASSAAEAYGTRVVFTRFGVVLGKNGGAVRTMLPAFKFGVGGPLGSGQQWFPWVHVDDLTRAIVFVLETETISGPVNLVSEVPCRQKIFAKALGKQLNRPAFLPVPGILLRLVMGEFGGSLLASQRGKPEVLLNAGFRFDYPSIETALKQLLA